MKLFLILSMIFLSASTVSADELCYYNQNGEIDWGYQCEVRGVAKLAPTCEKWPVFARVTTSTENCYGTDEVDALSRCEKLAEQVLMGEVPVHNSCGRKIIRPIKKVKWKLKELIEIQKYSDQSPKGIYETIARGKMKRKRKVKKSKD